MVLLREIIGETLRTRRQSQRRTLRDVSSAANVSLGYLSEVERGHKEASSELLSSICEALELPMSDVLDEVADEVARNEAAERAATRVRLLRPATADPSPSSASAELQHPAPAPVSLDAVRARRARRRSGRNEPAASLAA